MIKKLVLDRIYKSNSSNYHFSLFLVSYPWYHVRSCWGVQGILVVLYTKNTPKGQKFKELIKQSSPGGVYLSITS